MTNINDLKTFAAGYQNTPLWDGWYIKEIIGESTFGVVYRAEKHQINRIDEAAVKFVAVPADEYRNMYANQPIDNTELEEIIRTYLFNKLSMASKEPDIMVKLKECPYIVHHGDETATAWLNDDKSIRAFVLIIRMELLKSLSDAIKDGNTPLTEDEVFKVAHDIGNAIKAIHDIDYLHRDIKIENMFRSKETSIYKLGDFNSSEDSVGSAVPLEYPVGTNAYMAPEVYFANGNNKKLYTKKADIYSFGISLYRLMNDGLFPFQATSSDEDCNIAVKRRVDGEMIPPPKHGSQEFVSVILRACAYNEEDRFNSIDEMLFELDLIHKKRKFAEDIANRAAEKFARKAPDTINPKTLHTRRKSAMTPQLYTERRVSELDLDELVSASLNEYANAQNEIGNRYFYGVGIEQNYDMAIRSYIDSANKGFMPAILNLGRCFNEPNIDEQSKASIFYWFLAAYEAGAKIFEPNILSAIARYYYEENDIENPFSEKSDLFVEPLFEANALGDYTSDTTYLLGIAYYYGNEVKRDYSEAVKWYSLSAADNNIYAMKALADCYIHGVGVEKNYKKAVDWLKRYGNEVRYQSRNNSGGNSEIISDLMIADCYYYGDSTLSRNLKEAAKYYFKNINGLLSGSYDDVLPKAGNCFYKVGDFKSAVKCYQGAGDRIFTDLWAVTNFADCFYSGKGVEQNYQEAINLYMTAAHSSFAPALMALAKYCSDVINDYASAFAWYERAAYNGVDYALYMVGLYYYQGIGVEQNTAYAAQYLKIAAEHNYMPAVELINSSPELSAAVSE